MSSSVSFQAAVTVGAPVHQAATSWFNCHKLTHYILLVRNWFTPSDLLSDGQCFNASPLTNKRVFLHFQGPHFQEFLSWSVNEDCVLIMKCKVRVPSTQQPIISSQMCYYEPKCKLLANYSAFINISQRSQRRVIMSRLPENAWHKFWEVLKWQFTHLFHCIVILNMLVFMFNVLTLSQACCLWVFARSVEKYRCCRSPVFHTRTQNILQRHNWLDRYTFIIKIITEGSPTIKG